MILPKNTTFASMPCRIKAVRYALPPTVYTNADYFAEFPDMVGSSIEKTGVKIRHIAQKTEVSSDLALLAAENLLREENIEASSIDFLLYNSADLDFYTPATACVVHGKLGLRSDCGAMDIVNGCSSFVYGLGMASGIIETMGARNVLLLTSSFLTRYIHKGDKANRFLFGDGAAATFITRAEQPMIGPFSYGTDGKSYEKIIIRDGFARFPLSETSYADRIDQYGNVTNDASFDMDGTSIFLFSNRVVPPLIKDVLQKASLEKNDIDLFIFHQPNVFLNEHLRKKMDIPEARFFHCMENFGNTVQSTIPIAIREAQLQGKLKPGMTVLLAGFGTGLSWAATIVRF
jgi:3-oxoacyl-[acyl-carrier-protein] synthase-3